MNDSQRIANPKFPIILICLNPYIPLSRDLFSPGLRRTLVKGIMRWTSSLDHSTHAYGRVAGWEAREAQ